jgi:hypothetical protein
VGKPSDDPLLDAAASISDGTEVNWTAVGTETASDDETTAIVQQLQIVERIARLHGNMRGRASLDLRGPIGHGSFGLVHRAFDPDLQREIALKVLRLGTGLDVDRALNEARMLARVKHPNVVSVFRVERGEDEVGLWMEYIDGQTLDDLVRLQGRFGAREAALIGLDLCRALAAVHAAGLVHGDVKAHNVMREQGGRVVLMDFGAGKDLARAHDPARGDFAGTPLYVAPEVFRGAARSTSSDIYSLGVLLYYLVTGSYPIEGSTKTEIRRHHDEGATTRRRLRDARPDLPAPFVQAVEGALGEGPEQRYRSAGEFEVALTTALPRAPYPRALAAAAVIAVVALAGAAAYWRSAERAAAPAAAPAAASSTTAVAPPPAVPASYRIDAGFYRVRGTTEERLAAGARVAPGDELFFRFTASRPTHVYVVNEDDRGESYLLHPLPGRITPTPLAASRQHELPGVRGGDRLFWTVTSAGGREHFLVFANPERLTTFEQLFESLPPPTREQAAARLSPNALGLLRGVGGLASAPAGANASMRLADQFTTPLADTPEEATGLWVRKVTLENPGK